MKRHVTLGHKDPNSNDAGDYMPRYYHWTNSKTIAIRTTIEREAQFNEGYVTSTMLRKATLNVANLDFKRAHLKRQITQGEHYKTLESWDS